jgi:hypothetical protein
MPTKHRLRLYYLDCTRKVGPEPDQRSQNSTVDAVEAQPRWRMPQGNVELVAEKQILGLKPPTRLEQISDQDRNSPQSRRHHGS